MKTNEFKFNEEEQKKREALQNKRRNELLHEADAERDKATQDALLQSESSTALSMPEVRLKLEGLRFDYREVGQLIFTWLKPGDSGSLSQIKTDTYEKEERETRSELEGVKSRLQNDPMINKVIPQGIGFAKRLLVYLSVLLVVSETLFDSQAFSSMKIWYVAAVLIALGFNAVKLVVIYLLTRLLQNMSNPWMKVLVVSGTLVSVTLVLVMVAQLRMQTLKQAGVIEELGVLTFMVISLVFFIGMWGAHVLAEPYRDELRKSRQLKHDYRQHREMRKKKERLESRLRELQNLKLQVNMSGALDKSEAKSLLSTLENHYRATWNNWLALYMKGRRTKGETIDDRLGEIVPERLFGTELDEFLANNSK